MQPPRHIPRFCPFTDFADRYPSWTYHVTDLHGLDEVVDVERRLLLIDPKADGEAWALAHATAHLDLEHHQGSVSSFTEEKERDANDLAALKMDSAGLFARSLDWIEHAREELESDYDLDGIPVDGPPSVTL